jgi:ATP-dependent Clp protease ATP-binding subunit ClpA
MHGVFAIKVPKFLYPLTKLWVGFGGRTSKHKSFSAEVQAAVKNSREQALQRHHRCIEREHLLMSVLEPPRGRIHEILNSLGCDITRLQQKTAEALAAYPKTKPNANIPFSKLAGNVFGLACGIAEEFDSATIEIEYIFLAMWKQENNWLAQALNIDYETFCSQLKRLSAN